MQGAPFFRLGQAPLEYDEEACVWSITASVALNARKLELPEYRRHVPRIPTT